MYKYIHLPSINDVWIKYG